MPMKFRVSVSGPIWAIQPIALGQSHAGQGLCRLDRQAATDLQGRAAPTELAPMAKHYFNAKPESSGTAQHSCAVDARRAQGPGVAWVLPRHPRYAGAKGAVRASALYFLPAFSCSFGLGSSDAR